MRRGWLIAILSVGIVWASGSGERARAGDAAEIAAGIAALLLGPNMEVNDYYYYDRWVDWDDDGFRDPDEIKNFRQERMACTLWSKSSFAYGRVKPEVLNLLANQDLLVPEFTSGTQVGTFLGLDKDLTDSDGLVPVVVLSSNPNAVLEEMNSLGQEIEDDKELINLWAFEEADKKLDADLRRLEEQDDLLDKNLGGVRQEGTARRARLNQVLETFGASIPAGGTAGTLTIAATSPLGQQIAEYDACVEKKDEKGRGQCANAIQKAYRDEIERLLKNLGVQFKATATFPEILDLARKAVAQKNVDKKETDNKEGARKKGSGKKGTEKEGGTGK
jgi:hypothetical protein